MKLPRPTPATVERIAGIALVVVMVAVIARAGRIQPGDGSHFISIEMRLADLLRDLEVGRFARFWLTLVAPHPPLGYLPGIAAFFLLGHTPLAHVLAGGLAAWLVVDGLLRLGDGRGLAAALAFTASPMVWLAVEGHGRDLAAAACAVQAVSWLHASAGFQRRRQAMAFGAWLGAGFLVKYTFPMFMILVCLGAAVHLRSKARWHNLGAAIAAFALVAGGWWAVMGHNALAYLGANMGSNAGAEAKLLTWAERMAPEHLSMYPLALKDALGWPGIVALAAGAWWAPKLPLAGALGGLAVLAIQSQAQDRYALPALALACGAAVSLGRSTLGSLAALVVFAPLYVTSAVAFSPAAHTATTSTYQHPLTTWSRVSWPGSRTYNPIALQLGGWHLERPLAALREAQGRDDGTVGLLLSTGGGVPEFGTVVMSAQYLGYRWDYANVVPRGPGRTDVFVGPLFDGAWPSKEFTALLALQCPGPDHAQGEWLAAFDGQQTAAFDLPSGCAGSVWSLQAAPSGG